MPSTKASIRLRSIADLKRVGAIVDPDAKRGRGRPKRTTSGQLLTSRTGAWALEVFKEAARSGLRRGAQAAAISAVARRQPSYSPALKASIENRIRTAVKRHPEHRSAGEGLAAFELMAEELERRTRGFPSDVKAVVYEWPADELLELLRNKGVDGTCPDELIELARRSSE